MQQYHLFAQLGNFYKIQTYVGWSFGKYAEVAGISIDSVWSHKAWKEKMGLKHTLLADMHRKVCKAYGVYLPAAPSLIRASR